MTIEEAFDTDRQIILTFEGGVTVVMVRPYCIFPDGTVYGEMQDGTDWLIDRGHITSVELGEEIR